MGKVPHKPELHNVTNNPCDRRRIPDDIAFVDVFLDKSRVPEIPATTFVEGAWFDGASCPSSLSGFALHAAKQTADAVWS
jgi:hypothetical protein